MTALVPQRISITGLVPVLSAATEDGDTVRPSPTTFIWVANSDESDHAVTLNDPRTAAAVVGGASGTSDADLDVDVTIPAGGFKLIGVGTRFLDPSTGLASWSYDDETDLTIGAFYLPAGAGANGAVGSITAADQKITEAGLAPSFTAAGAGQKFRCGARRFLLVKNAHSADHSITLDDPTSVGPTGANQFDPDVVVSVAHTTVYSFIGPLDGRFADASDGYRADGAWSLTTSMSYAALTI